MENIASRIKDVRKEKRLTQAAFAEKLGITPSYVSKLEASKESASETLIRLICMEFGVNQKWLLNGEGERRSSLADSNKDESDFILGSALQDLQKLLSTASNVKYSNYSYSTGSLVSILLADGIDTNYEFEYLANIEMFMSNLLRVLSSFRRLLLEKKLSQAETDVVIANLKSSFYSIDNALFDVLTIYIDQAEVHSLISVEQRSLIKSSITQTIRDIKR
ncbi:MAG: helix-turn-helix transcriptional regulator [Clostridiaceae bacterium]